MQDLRTRFPKYNLTLIAHSQGSAVVSEALNQGAPCDNYILTQAATPASAYHILAPTVPDLVTADFIEPTPEWQPMGYRGIYTNLTGVINLYNPQDYALGIWVLDQKISKPDGVAGARNYTYDGTNGYAVLDEGLFRVVTDSAESRGMISRSKTLAIGAQGQTSQGATVSSVNLNTEFGFYDVRSEHSAQFNRPIQTVLSYYNLIVDLIGSE
jgi:hypothetical protein